MEVSSYLSLTEEEKSKRKKKWKERQKKKGQGLDPEEEIANDRALKALYLIKKHLSGEITISDTQINVLCALVIERSKKCLYFFAKHVLGFDLLTDQTHKRWADDLITAIKKDIRRVMRLKPRKTYKCLKKGTLLLNYGIDGNYNIVPAKLINQKDFIEDGIEVIMKSGRKYICTKDHPFKTINGWGRARIGLRTALIRKIPNPYKSIDEAEEYLMGLLVGDGCLRKGTPKLTCSNQEILDKLKEYGFIVNKQGDSKYNYSILNFYNKVRECGLEGTDSWNKFIPQKYEGSSHFLRGLFDADASVSNKESEIIFVTVSEKLADDVLRNLLYFGIVARKKFYKYIETEKSPAVECYKVNIYGEFIKEYHKYIGFNCNGKKERLNSLINNSRIGKNSNCDTIPKEWRKLLKSNEKRNLRYDLGLRIDNHYATSRNKALKCGKYLKNRDVIQLAEANIFWDEICEINDTGPTEFSAIGSDIENFITSDGMIHHNSTLYGVSFVLWLWGCISPKIRIFYTSSSGALIDEIADSFGNYVGTEKNETLYSFVFGITRQIDKKNTSNVFNIQGREGKGFSLTLRTSGGSTTGTHPNVIIADDPVGEKDRDFEVERRSKERWFDTLQPLLVPFDDPATGLHFESIYYIGTRWHIHDLVYYIKEELIKKKGQLWDIESESIIGPDGHAAYPEFYSDEKIAEDRKSMTDVFFACQMLNDPLPEGMQTFDLNRLHFIRPSQFREIFRYGQLICAFDPSLGKKHSDYPAVWWGHYINDTITLFDAIDEKVELTLLVHQIAYKNKLYHCRKMVYEDNGVTLVGKAIDEAHERLGWRMDIDTVHHGSDSNKHERIVSTQPDLYSGHVRFLSDYERRYPEAMNQIVFYGAYSHDDFPDCLEMIITYFKKPHFQYVRYDAKL
jgi:hypothetical protein